MKKLLLLLSLLISCACPAQPSIKMRTMWDRPQVHVKFGEYTLSFTVQHINKALELIAAETGDSTNGTNIGLDTNGNFVVEVYEGPTQVYSSRLQRLMQNELGAFLITAKRAYIVRSKHHKVVREVIVDVDPPELDLNVLHIRFYDPANHKLVFVGSMRRDMYNRDLGLD